MASNSLNRGYIGINQFNVANGLPDTRNQYLNNIQTQSTPIPFEPSFRIDFTGSTWQNQVSFSRGGTATFLGSSGYITVAGPNVPRIQYGLSGNTLGLLIEPSVGVRWSYNNVSITNWGRNQILGTTAYDNVALGPDGTTTAMWVVPTTANWPEHSINAGSGLAVASTDGYLTFSVFLKREFYTAAAVTISRTSVPVFSYTAFVDLITGSVYHETSSDGYYGYAVSEQYPNNWWKVTVTMKSRDFTNQYAIISVLPNSTWRTLGSYAGTGTGGIYVWGSNYHGVGAPVQYINQNGMVYKVEDVCYSSGTSFTSWYTYPGCFYMEYYNKPDKFNMSSFGTSNADTGRVTSSTTILSTPYRDKNTFFVSNGDMIGNKTAFCECLEDYMLSTNGKTQYQQLNKMAVAISGTTFPYTLRFSLNGSNIQQITTSNFDAQGISAMMFGSRAFLTAGTTVPSPSVAQYNGILKEFRFYNSNLTDDQIRALTT